MSDPDPQTKSGSSTTRRATLGVIVVACAGALGFGSWLRRRPPPLTRLPDVLGFQRFSTAVVTGAVDPFAGLEAPGGDPLRPTPGDVTRVTSELCQELFGPDGTERTLAIFTDYNCPICRQFENDVAELPEVRSGAVALRWLELPLLGDSSVLAARLALAADRQGAYSEMRQILIRSRVVAGDAYAANLALRLGLDPDRLIADTDSEQITTELRTVRALSGVFEVPGTPSMAIGSTVVIGAAAPSQLRELIENYRPAPC